MKNYSEDANRQYHIQTAEGEVGRYVIRREIRGAVRRLHSTWIIL